MKEFCLHATVYNKKTNVQINIRISEKRNGLVWIDRKLIAAIPILRSILRLYFMPNRLESYHTGLIYRLLGINAIAYIIPTGGLLWRRLFHWKGWSFALQGSSIRAAYEYIYTTCVFEILHLSALMLMLHDGIWSIRHGYTDGILKFVLAGILMNGYPAMLQRYNRVRIIKLLEKHKERTIQRPKRLSNNRSQ